MKRIALFIGLMVTMFGCDAQQKESQRSEEQDTVAFEPQTEIRVNKEYDDRGNLIRYDSVYSSYYSNIEGDTALHDSVFNQFMNKFNDRFPFSSEPFFNEMFFTDSLLHYDFFKDDFFQNRFERNLYHMDEYFRRMDSLKNYFFRKQIRSESPKKTTL